MTRRLRAATLLPLLALCLAGSLTACGGDDEDAAPQGTTTVTETVTATPTPEVSESTSPTETTTPSESDPATPGPDPTPEPDPEVDLSQPPATYDEALAHLEGATGQPQELSRFESPTGNLYCVLDAEFVPASCELDRGTVEDPALCGDGPSRFVGRIEFSDGDPQPVCNSDTIREPGAPVLGYGAVASWPGTSITCVLEEIGVTCVNPPASQGFFLAKGRYQVFA